MIYVARVNDEGFVREVHWLTNQELPENGEYSKEVEDAANNLQNALGFAGEWKLTSSTGKFRRVFAGIGYTYDSDLDEFVAPEVPEETD
jgi:hypothetical protein